MRVKMTGAFLIILVTHHPEMVSAQSEAPATAVASGLSIGVREWPAVTNGLIFVDGKYIPPPYLVSRNEGEILVNGTHLDWAMLWPPRKKHIPVIPSEEPTMPESITRRTTEYDKDYISYIYNMRQYLMNKFGTQKGVEMMVDIYLKLPCVADAQIDPEKPDCIIVTWVTGEKNYISQTSAQRGEDHFTREQAEHFIDRITEIYIRGLSNNHYFMVGSTIGRRGAPESFSRTLIPLADAMRTAKDETDFLAIMKTNQPPGGMSEAAFRAFYRHRDDLPKWEPRVREAVEKGMR